MRIGIDITPVTAQRTGVGEYVSRLITHLLPLLPPDSLRGWATGLHPPVPPDTALKTRYVPMPTRAAYALWRSLRQPKVDTLLGGLDLFHATNYFLPPVKRAKRVLTIYDLAFLIEPVWASPKIVGPFSRETPQFARDADAVITCSEHSRQDIIRLCGVPKDRVHVAYGAPDPNLQPIGRETAHDRLRRLSGWDGPFILSVGTLEPRKNFETLVRAFAAIHQHHPHKLVLVGGRGWGMDHLPGLIRQLHLEEKVLLPGYLPSREDLIAAYCATDLFVIPSHYEGFGLPLVEAMACGCPCLASQSSSLPEVGGGAVRYFDPKDDTALATAMDSLLNDTESCKDLGQQAILQSKQFTWEATAQQVLNVYRGIL